MNLNLEIKDDMIWIFKTLLTDKDFYAYLSIKLDSLVFEPSSNLNTIDKESKRLFIGILDGIKYFIDGGKEAEKIRIYAVNTYGSDDSNAFEGLKQCELGNFECYRYMLKTQANYLTAEILPKYIKLSEMLNKQFTLCNNLKNINSVADGYNRDDSERYTENIVKSAIEMREVTEKFDGEINGLLYESITAFEKINEINYADKFFNYIRFLAKQEQSKNSSPNGEGFNDIISRYNQSHEREELENEMREMAFAYLNSQQEYRINYFDHDFKFRTILNESQNYSSIWKDKEIFLEKFYE